MAAVGRISTARTRRSLELPGRPELTCER